MGKKLLFLFVVGFVFISCKAQTLEVKNNDPRLEYMGRITHLNYASVLSWPGSSVALNFEGADLSVKLKDEKGENYYYAIIDDGEPIRLHPTTELKSYALATHLRKGRHNALLYKLTESRTGKTWFYGFELDKDAHILPPSQRDKRIEFYGNSITVGYSVDDTVADSNKPEFTNNYFSYAAITARNYKASYSCIAKSGIGFMISWFDLIMPDMYDRAQEDDADTKWDFTQYTPNIVVVDLGQNDSWLVYKRDFAQFKKRFGAYPPNEPYIINAYTEFIKSIRMKYPEATIICTLGSMDATRTGSPWPGYIKSAVAPFRDKKILTHFFPYNNTDKHPKREEQMYMAKELINFINNNARW